MGARVLDHGSKQQTNTGATAATLQPPARDVYARPENQTRLYTDALSLQLSSSEKTAQRRDGGYGHARSAGSRVLSQRGAQSDQHVYNTSATAASLQRHNSHRLPVRARITDLQRTLRLLSQRGAQSEEERVVVVTGRRLRQPAYVIDDIRVRH